MPCAVWVCLFLGFCFFFHVLSFLHSHKQFISQFNNINKKKQQKKNRIMLMTSFIFGRSQQSCIANCIWSLLLSKEAAPSGNLSCCLFTFNLHYEMYLQNHPMATVCLQTQLHHQSWMPGGNQRAPDVKMQVLSIYAEGEFLLAFGWTQAMLIGWLTIDSTAYQN